MKTRVLYRAGEGAREYRIPGMLRLPDGAMLLCYEARYEDKNDWGDIDAVVDRLEADGSLATVFRVGRSHLPPDGSMRTYNNPTLISDGETVHLIYHLNYERAFIVTSRDGGHSFGEPREITSAFRKFPFDWNVCATGPGHGLRLDSGRLCVPVWLAMGQVLADGKSKLHYPSVCGILFSDDHGMTWHAGAMPQGLDSANETCIASPDGVSLLMNIRTRDPRRCRHMAVTAPGGEAIASQWMADTLPDPACFGSMDGFGKKIGFTHCHTDGKRTDLTLLISPDGGKSWQKEALIDPIGGYADMVLEEKRFFIFYEHTDYERNLISELVLAEGEMV